MMTLDGYFASYAAYHRTTGNKVTHYVGIPLILFSTLGMLALVKLQAQEQIDLGLIVWLLGSLFYCRLDLKRGLPFSTLTLGLYFMAREVPVTVNVALFVGGWILQGIGHYAYEKKSPAFLTNLSHLLIGPFWIFCHFWPFGKSKA